MNTIQPLTQRNNLGPIGYGQHGSQRTTQAGSARSQFQPGRSFEGMPLGSMPPEMLRALALQQALQGGR